MNLQLNAISLICTLGTVISQADAAIVYTLTDLGTLSGSIDSLGRDISATGEVSGEAANPSNHGFFWSRNEGLKDIGALPGDSTSQGIGINDKGQIVGQSYGNSQNSSHAFLWSSVGGMQSIGISGFAAAINNNEQVVGYDKASDSAFIWTSSGGQKSLGTLPGDTASVALNINSNGAVAGYSYGSGYHAFMWSSIDGMQEIEGLPGSTATFALDINDNEQVIGTSMLGNVNRAFLWSAAGGVQDLGNLPGATHADALGLNNLGVVVGNSGTSSSREAFVWMSGRGMLNLNELLDSTGKGWYLAEAREINDNGQIVGTGAAPNGRAHAILLTPSVVPDSLFTAYALIAALSGLELLRRRI